MRFSIWFVLFVCCLAMPVGAAPRNVVLFVTDDQGQDAGCYGNSVLKTPNLDALAADGTRFKYSYCTTASCSPSRSVILSGLHNHANAQYGLEHGYNHFRSYENLRTLPVLLGDAGYRTARVGKYHVAPEQAYQFQVVLPASDFRKPVEMANLCREFIEADSEQPFFLYFCPGDPHRAGPKREGADQPDSFGNKTPKIASDVQYAPNEVIVPPFLPDTPACRAELAEYYQSVSRADSGLGRLVEILKQAGNYDDTLIIYISDNGIPFPGAKTTLYEPGIRLPCVVRNPVNEKRGVVSEAFVSWVDIAPTILDFAGVKKQRRAEMQGRSFLSILDEEAPAGWDETYGSHTLHEVTMYYPMRMVRSGRYKLIWNIAHPLPFPFANDLWMSSTWQDSMRRGDDFVYGKRTIKALVERPRFELYDLESDPNEVHNLADDPKHQDRLAELQAKLREFQQRTRDPWKVKWDRE